ncbi:MAG: adenosylmethionine--8-amino-7-oxononanoate transaminase [Planctomycetota bacterium]|nr:MAG: adenosylmethionine--8-amino-7-oxononanoate transaminase [Planctomycetota bacterium]
MNDQRGNRDASGDLVARDARCVWHPYTQHQLEAAPLPVASASGARLRLHDGRELVDAISSWWTCLHGHGEPQLVEALRAQAARLDHVLFAGATHEPAVRLAEELVRRAPRGLSRVFYSDDGSTAVEVALKLVRQHWVQHGESQRAVFVALECGYHGDTFGAMAVGDPDPFFRAFEPLLFRVERASIEAGALEALVARLGSSCAGVIVEPLVQGAGGMRMHAPEFLRAVRATCDRHGVPLIADEVMTGFGRTGELFACAKAGIEPDLLCVAKGLTGGMLPLAATLCREPLYASFLHADRSKAFFHGHSFTANPIACAVALASLALVDERDTPRRLDALGASIERELAAALGARAADLALRRCGGIVALDLPGDSSGGGAGYLSTRALALRALAIERGVLLRPLGNVVYAMPPACTSAEDASRIARAMLALVDPGR